MRFRKLEWFAVCAIVVGMLLLGAAMYNYYQMWIPMNVEEAEPKDLCLVVSDITLDVTTQYVFPSDFVRTIRKSDHEAPRVSNANMFSARLELMSMAPEDQIEPWWETREEFTCDDLGTTEFWIRVQDDGNGWSEEPVRAYLTVVDSTGQCGERMFNPGPNEEE